MSQKSSFPIVNAFRENCAKAFKTPPSTAREKLSFGKIGPPFTRFCRSCGHSFVLSRVDQDAFCCGKVAAATTEPPRRAGAEEDWILL